MATFAVIENNKVVNLILAETKNDAELATNKFCVEYTTENSAGIGYTYNGTEFVAPEAPTE
jgi:hypothetical protein